MSAKKKSLSIVEIQEATNLESKRALRRSLAARPIGEKLRMLDAMRERHLAIRGRAPHADSSVLRDNPTPCRTTPE